MTPRGSTGLQTSRSCQQLNKHLHKKKETPMSHRDYMRRYPDDSLEAYGFLSKTIHQVWGREVWCDVIDVHAHCDNEHMDHVYEAIYFWNERGILDIDEDEEGLKRVGLNNHYITEDVYL